MYNHQTNTAFNWLRVIKKHLYPKNNSYSKFVALADSKRRLEGNLFSFK